MAPFTFLALEILEIIVTSFNKRDLHSCTLTNKQLYMVTNPLLWRLRQLSDGDTIDTILNESIIARHPVGQRIQTLKLYGCYWTDVRLFALIDNGVSQLEELRLIKTDSLSDASLVHLARRCPQLNTVYLWQVSGITQRFMDALGNYCYRLTKLVCYDCERLGGDMYNALGDCPLQALSISSPPSILQTEMAMWDMIIYCRFLTELKLGTTTRFMEDLFSAAVSAWPDLTSLTLDGYDPRPSLSTRINNMSIGRSQTPVEQEALIEFLSYHPDIQHLSFRNCRISDSTLDRIADLELPCLNELILNNTFRIDGATIRRLIHSCPSLKFIMLWGSGISVYEFPECGVQYHDLPSCPPGHHNCQRFSNLHHLDREDIRKIRLRSESSPSTTMDPSRMAGTRPGASTNPRFLTINNTRSGTTSNSGLATITNTRSGTTSNSGLATITNTRSGTITNTRSGTIINTRSGTVTNTRSGTIADSRLATTANTRSGTTTNSRLGTTTNTRSGTTANTRSGTTTNSRLATTTNSRLATITNTRSGTTSYTRSGATMDTRSDTTRNNVSSTSRNIRSRTTMDAPPSSTTRKPWR